MGLHAPYNLGPSEGVVTDPDGTRRRAELADSVLTVNGDGTVAIPRDVEVYQIDDCLWLRTPRLRGWAMWHPDAPIVCAAGDRRLGDEVNAELARQGRVVVVGWPSDARPS